MISCRPFNEICLIKLGHMKLVSYSSSFKEMRKNNYHISSLVKYNGCLYWNEYESWLSWLKISQRVDLLWLLAETNTIYLFYMHLLAILQSQMLPIYRTGVVFIYTVHLKEDGCVKNDVKRIWSWPFQGSTQNIFLIHVCFEKADLGLLSLLLHKPDFPDNVTHCDTSTETEYYLNLCPGYM